MRGYSRYRFHFFVIVDVGVTRYSFENLPGCILKVSIFWLFIPLVDKLFTYFIIALVRSVKGRIRQTFIIASLLAGEYGIVTVTLTGISRPREGEKAEILRILDGTVDFPPENPFFQAIWDLPPENPFFQAI